MSAHSTTCFALCAAVLFAGELPGLHAQPQPPRKPVPKSATARPKTKTVDGSVRPAANTEREDGKVPRPKTEQLRVKPLSPELKQLLIDWERESAKIKTLVGEHQRIVVNSVFETEKWAKGKFYYESPDKGRIDLEGIQPNEDQVSKLINKTTGQRYRLEADQETRWICTGKHILQINDSEKEVEMIEIPEDLQGENIIHGPLPFLFGLKAEEAERRFEIDYYAENNPAKNNAKTIWLIAKPRQGADKENFREAHIILDRKRFLPTAVKLFDQSGNLVTTYEFKELHVNQRSLIPPIFRNDPFNPNFRGYNIVLRKVSEPEDASNGANKRPSKPNVRQAAGETPQKNGTPTQRPRTANSGGTKTPPRTKK